MEFWEASFLEKQVMYEPTDSAIKAKDIFIDKSVKNILLPGIGYGRNAKVFIEKGIDVTGIEISKTAIDLARKNGLDIPIFHGPVRDMPFNNKQYDGIFSHALIHLLNQEERLQFLQDCYNQLKPNGYMIFTTVSKGAPMYGKGKQLDKDYYETKDGVKLYFYDAESIDQDFKDYGLVDSFEVEEPNKDSSNKPSMKFTMIICRKDEK
ncbi:class I SAM-dependent methyltransferase [Oceanobacillus iheyensis]|uniref:class I SAM-dependent methyltransferase n=1 Tax=Oceanobacillus iheyensis TaxID=182710 RepID=UPI003629D1DD